MRAALVEAGGGMVALAATFAIAIACDAITRRRKRWHS